MRARFAFGTWPRLSADDPWVFVNRAPIDLLSIFFPYSLHLETIYILLPPALIGFVCTVYPLLIGKQRITGQIYLQIFGCIAAAAILTFQNGRFFWWFLD